jgi:hypothetical protein
VPAVQLLESDAFDIVSGVSFIFILVLTVFMVLFGSYSRLLLLSLGYKSERIANISTRKEEPRETPYHRSGSPGPNSYRLGSCP